MTMTDSLIPPAFLFRLAAPCYHFAGKWRDAGVDLDERFVITSFDAELNQGPRFAELRLGWNQAGLYIYVRTTGKKQSPWCRAARPDESDGLSLLVDTRDTQNIHRAGRFCHRFLFLPQGSGRLMNEPTAALVEIPRAREHPKPAPAGSLRIHAEKRIDGYLLSLGPEYPFLSDPSLWGTLELIAAP
jgi:hypothetical protein